MGGILLFGKVLCSGGDNFIYTLAEVIIDSRKRHTLSAVPLLEPELEVKVRDPISARELGWCLLSEIPDHNLPTQHS